MSPLAKRLIFPLVFIVIMLSVAGWRVDQWMHAKNPDPNHNHADFAVWINGKQLDFAQAKYMSGSSDPADPAHEEHDKFLHLHDGNGHVVHRHKPGLGFGDFLKTIGFQLTADCLTLDTNEKICAEGNLKWQLFVNGKEKVPFDPNYVFADGDNILLTYGADATEVKHELSLMTNDACRYSLTCPWRGKAPTESCVADPTVPCKLGS